MRLLLTTLILWVITIPSSVAHSVSLSCTDSDTTVTFAFYRATVSGGPYSQINTSPVATCAFTDTLVTAGSTYYYVAQAVDSSGTHSANSNQVSAVIPTAPVPPTSLTVTVK